MMAVFLAGPGAQAAERGPLTFGAGVEAINVNVTVSDTRGRYVTDLRQQDFLVIEDGQRQDVSVFAQEKLPLSVAVLIDASLSMQPRLSLAKAAALRLVAGLRPEDEVQVVGFNHRVQVVHPFDAPRAALPEAFAALRAQGGTSLYTALYVTLKEVAARGAKGEPRRRALVVLSDGEDTSSRVGDEDVLTLARQSGVNVYTVGLRCQTSDLADPSSLLATHFLTALARETGAEVYFPARLSDLEPIYGHIGEELRSQYSLGYVPARAGDGRWRRIVIRIPGREDVLVRHRLGYRSGR